MDHRGLAEFTEHPSSPAPIAGLAHLTYRSSGPSSTANPIRARWYAPTKRAFSYTNIHIGIHTMSKSRPVHEIRIGRIVAVIWANNTSLGMRHRVTLSKVYKDDSNAWQRTDSFWRDDMPTVEKVADLAFRWIHDNATAGEGSAA